MAGRSLSPDENERVLAALRDAIRAGETQVSLAGKLKVNQATLSSLLARRHGAGYAFARSLAGVLGMSIDQLLRGQDTDHRGHVWNDHPGWSEAIAQARVMFPRVSPEAWAWLGSLSGPSVPGLAPVALGMMASAWDNAQPDEARRKGAS